MARNVEQRARMDLKFHFTRKTLRSLDPKFERTRKELLLEEYTEGAEGGGMGQSNAGYHVCCPYAATLCHMR